MEVGSKVKRKYGKNHSDFGVIVEIHNSKFPYAIIKWNENMLSFDDLELLEELKQ